MHEGWKKLFKLSIIWIMIWSILSTVMIIGTINIWLTWENNISLKCVCILFCVFTICLLIKAVKEFWHIMYRYTNVYNELLVLKDEYTRIKKEDEHD